MLINKTSTRYRDAYLKKKIGIIIKSHDTNKKEKEEKKTIKKNSLTSTVSQHYVLHLKRVQDYKFQGNRKMLHFCKLITNGSYIRDLTIQIKPGDRYFVVVLQAKLNCTRPTQSLDSYYSENSHCFTFLKTLSAALTQSDQS